MTNFSKKNSALAFLFAAATVAFCTPAASAAISLVIDTSTNTVTFTVDGGSTITLQGSDGEERLRVGTSSFFSTSFANMSTTVDIMTTSGSGDWGGSPEFTLYFSDSGQTNVFGLDLYSFESNTVENWSGTIVTTYDDISTIATAASSLSNYNTGSGTGPVNVSVVPEPSSLALGGLGLAGLLMRRRRRVL